ncbi:MAG: 2-C-methyl-D-erythritol 4-phosphate cytidylyltransferase [Candidatus Melainabacteria bacterium]|nr:2-C-methyl-D-erythritol 4-phosphate cytidylyltransferase [Candidatus Melainabacteria bacterium]
MEDNYQGQRFACVITAGGSGSRFGGSRPKQFEDLLGYPLYIWSIYTCMSIGAIADIVVTMPAEYIDLCRQQLTKYINKGITGNQELNLQVIEGGSTRQASVYRALQKLKNAAPDFVMVHDGARPLVSAEYFRRCMETLTTRGACTIGLPISDTIKEVEDGKIISTLDRSRLWSVQTPQGAPFSLLLACHEEAAARGISVTDDAAILEAFGHKVEVFEGFTHNIKVTVADDFKTCQLLAPLYLSRSPMEP